MIMDYFANDLLIVRRLLLDVVCKNQTAELRLMQRAKDMTMEVHKAASKHSNARHHNDAG